MLAVIIPAYNRPNCLREALQSLTIQTMKMFKVIVVDDCSKEDLKSVCDEFTQLSISYLRAPVNGGPGMARQIGINAAYRAHIDLITFLDSDDILMPPALERLKYEITHRGDDYVVSPIAVEQRHSTGFVLSGEEAGKIWLHGKIFRSDYLMRNEIYFPEGLRGNEDIAFCVKCFFATDKKSILEQPVYLWRDEKSSITRTKGEARDNVLSLDYIKASYDAIKYVEEKFPKKLLQLFPRIFFSYNYYQTALAKGMEIPPEIDEMCRDMIHIPVFYNELSDMDSLNELKDKILQYIVLDKKLYLFKQTFFEWLKQFEWEPKNDQSSRCKWYAALR